MHELTAKDIKKITKYRKLGMTWLSIAKALEIPLDTFKRLIAESDLKDKLKYSALDAFCKYEGLTVSGAMSYAYKIHLDKTRFKGFTEQEDKIPQIDMTFNGQLEQSRIDIEAILESRKADYEKEEEDISDFISDDSTLGRKK